MAEPMSDERLARLAADNEPAGDHLSGLTADEVAELVAEAKRARAELADMRASTAGLHDEWGVWYPGTKTTICDSERDARSRGTYGRHRPTVLRRKISDWEEVDRRG